MKKNFTLLTVFFLLALPGMACAETAVIEGDQAKALFAADKNKAKVLAQKNRQFILRAPDGSETQTPAAVTLNAGERLYIANEETTYIHNVYDVTDSSWVLRKQVPSSIAAITFDKPGKHELRCAIHPDMEIAVDVK